MNDNKLTPSSTNPDLSMPRMGSHIRPVRMRKFVIWLALFSCLLLLGGLEAENLLASLGLDHEITKVLVFLSAAIVFAFMFQILKFGLTDLMYGPQRRYREVLMEIPIDSLKKMSERYPELSQTERGVLRQVLNARCPGWSATVSGDIRTAFA